MKHFKGPVGTHVWGHLCSREAFFGDRGEYFSRLEGRRSFVLHSATAFFD